jgi:riboflavin synthase
VHLAGAKRLFTGLVEGVGTVAEVRRTGEELTVSIRPPFAIEEVEIGESIAVNGVCLTVTGISSGAFTVDISQESISRSTLGFLSSGQRVNLERALRLGDRLGGHLVLGHVDCVGILRKMEPRGRSWLMTVAIDTGIARYIIEKGSVAVDGISLTVNRCGRDFFDVNIIPQTGRDTTLLEKRPGDKVNIEADMIGKYVERLLRGEKQEEGSAGRIDSEFLLKHGYGE